ncbi:MAG: hypothetical protein GY793_05460, partial [Proteobacteria bacterium]|nr:hypothetical protein [Pseudomonadota bacterium]
KSKTKPFSFLDDDSTKNLMPSVPKFEGLGLENTKDQSQNSTQKDNWSVGDILKGNQGVLSDTMQKMRGIDPAKQGEQQLFLL